MKISFEYATQLQYENKALRERIRLLESGEAYIRLKKEYERLLEEKDREIRKLKAELDDSRRQSARNRENWFQVYEDMEKEKKKEIRETLLDIHSQHQSYNYVQPKNHIILLDNFALKAHKDNVEELKQKFQKYQMLVSKLNEYKKLEETAEQQKEFLNFQINEIEAANIQDENEDEELKKELEVLSNVEKIK